VTIATPDLCRGVEELKLLTVTTLKTNIHCMAYKNKQIRFSVEKNALLKAERGVGFEDVILAIEMGQVLDDLDHPNKEKYPNQSVFIIFITIKNYVYLVPYVEDETSLFLKTIIPSRKMNKFYNKAVNNEKS